MRKRSKMILLGVILLAFAAVGTNPLWFGGEQERAKVSQVVNAQNEVDQKASSQTAAIQQEPASADNAKAPKLDQLLDESFAKGKPVAVVYTYNAEC